MVKVDKDKGRDEDGEWVHSGSYLVNSCHSEYTLPHAD